MVIPNLLKRKVKKDIVKLYKKTLKQIHTYIILPISNQSFYSIQTKLLDDNLGLALINFSSVFQRLSFFWLASRRRCMGL